ncbi:MAG: hypothetical protein IPI49_33665 [Myxococcales bacterium]|nr:hypothetical protein [Myxococcales bacterium]
MNQLFGHVTGDEEAKKRGILSEVDQWTPDSGGRRRTDYYVLARDREEQVTVAEARDLDCFDQKAEVVNGKVRCNVVGWRLIERYVAALAAKDPKWKVPDDRQLAFEYSEPPLEADDPRPYWRSYYVDRSVRLTGSAISRRWRATTPTPTGPSCWWTSTASAAGCSAT